MRKSLALQEYDIELSYVCASKNQIADLLSREVTQ